MPYKVVQELKKLKSRIARSGYRQHRRKLQKSRSSSNRAVLQTMTNNNGYILALDVGEKRIGVAIASTIARLASPHTTLQNSESVFEEIANLVKNESVKDIVVGLPRSLTGKDSDQTRYARDFAKRLQDHLQLKVALLDEALTSNKAEAELRARNVKYEKGDVDALAATYILEDYLATINSMEKRI